jgi:hypothetical protein
MGWSVGLYGIEYDCIPRLDERMFCSRSSQSGGTEFEGPRGERRGIETGRSFEIGSRPAVCSRQLDCEMTLFCDCPHMYSR